MEGDKERERRKEDTEEINIIQVLAVCILERASHARYSEDGDHYSIITLPLATG